MKRKLISSALCLLMLVTTFASASCGKEEVDPNTLEIDGNTSRAMTLTIWGIKGEGTTDEAIAAVEEAMSSITESQFNTAIKLNLFDADEYDQALEEKMDAIQVQRDKEAEEAAAKKAAEKEAKKNKETTKETTTAEETSDTADETILDEYGLPATLFPEVEETQLDIFLMTDYDMLMKYKEKGVLSNLDEQLNSSSKLIKSYVHPTFLSSGKVSGSTVAILNNHPIGEYTYILLNKELMDKYYYDADNIKTFNDAYNFILDVGREEPAYEPFMGISSPIGINYFTLDGSPSVIGNMLAPTAVSGDAGAPRLLFGVKDWNTYIKNYVVLDNLGYIGDDTFDADDKFGVGIMKGTAEDIVAFEEDYYINVLQAPQGTIDNIYNGMFAVSTYTKNLARSMEIVTYLNTNSELVNLFTYGVRDVHYTIDREDILTVISDDYDMNPCYTGNMFISHAPEGMSPDYWEASKQQNLDAVLSPYFGFSFTEDMIDTALLDEVLDFSEDFFDGLKDQNEETIEEYLSTKNGEAVAIQAIQDWYGSAVEGNDKTIGKVYNDWYTIAHPAS